MSEDGNTIVVAPTEIGEGVQAAPQSAAPEVAAPWRPRYGTEVHSVGGAEVDLHGFPSVGAYNYSFHAVERFWQREGRAPTGEELYAAVMQDREEWDVAPAEPEAPTVVEEWLSDPAPEVMPATDAAEAAHSERTGHRNIKAWIGGAAVALTLLAGAFISSRQESPADQPAPVPTTQEIPETTTATTIAPPTTEAVTSTQTARAETTKPTTTKLAPQSTTPPRPTTTSTMRPPKTTLSTTAPVPTTGPTPTTPNTPPSSEAQPEYDPGVKPR